ncbi:MAG: hypothetical protein ACPL2D_00890 [Ignavibacteria bacterium]
MDILYLTRFFLKIDFRNREEKKLGRVIAIIISYLIANVLLSGNTYFLFDKNSFVLISFSTPMFLMGLLILSEYDNLFFEKSNLNFIKSLPLKNKHLFLSKFISATCYLIFFVLVLVIPQSIFYYYYDRSWFDIIRFIIVSFLFVLSSVSCITILYTVTLLVFHKTRFFLYLLQLTFIFYVLGVNSITSETIKLGRENLLVFTPIKYTPQYFFLRGIEGGIEFWIAFGVTISLFLMMYFLFINKYFLVSEILLNQNSQRKVYSGLKSIFLFQDVEKAILKNSDTRAGYWLALNMFLRSKSLRMRIFPILILPLLSTVVIIFTNQSNIFFNPDPSFWFFKTEIEVLNPSITLLLLLSSRLLLVNFLYSEEGTVNIVEFYKSLPIQSSKLFWIGVIVFVSVFLLFPIFIAVSICLLFVVDKIAVIANMIFIFSFIIFLNSLNLINIKILPFSLPSSRYSSFTRLGDVIFILPIGVVFLIFQILAFKNVVVFLLVTIGLFIFLEIFLRTKK